MVSTRTASRERAAGGPGSAAGAAVEVASLCKRYGTVQAVKDVSFSIGRGEVSAFRVWFSDWGAHQVIALDADGSAPG